jgi:hypothetical protein
MASTQRQREDLAMTRQRKGRGLRAFHCEEPERADLCSVVGPGAGAGRRGFLKGAGLAR